MIRKSFGHNILLLGIALGIILIAGGSVLVLIGMRQLLKR